MSWRTVLGHRMSEWLWVALGLLAAIYLAAPHMAAVTGYKLALVAIGGYVGYVLSLALEGSLWHGGDISSKRPHELRTDADEARRVAYSTEDLVEKHEHFQMADALERGAEAMLNRRALVVSAVLVACALGA